jgi:hypothetical protein|tara:strand:+ start:335 stop:568 length:234 start_codon:yes stop_codon:yes gene_type:complete
MEKSSEFELEELVEELEGVYLPDSRLEELDEIVDMVPGALERLKSMKSEDDKLFYYEELYEIASKLEEFKKGKEIPN